MTSPFETEFPLMPKIEGIEIATYQCGIKYKIRTDLLVVKLPENTIASGVFTKSTTASSNIEWARKAIKNNSARVLIVNSGNANAFNGQAGYDSIDRIVKISQEFFGCNDYEIFPCSTGVIGEVLPDNLITDSFKDLDFKQNYKDASEAIMTTDTFPKGVTKTVKINQKEVVINGIVKGSGMIAPNMATMLGYIFTDINIEAEELDKIFKNEIESSFNSITVDSDTSTSDTVLIFSTCKGPKLEAEELNLFKTALSELMKEMAQLVVKDGEGIQKFITVNVAGASNQQEAKDIAFSIANSPLVKTAIAGEDANWGRIIMAIGKTLHEVNRNKIKIAMGDIIILENGLPNNVEKELSNYMKGTDIQINVDLNQGSHSKTVWGCDLTHEYININADYRS